MIDWTIEQIRRTSAQMAADNPELSAGQLAVESDARMAKVGPGRYSELPYMIDIDMVKADAAWETDQRDGEGSSSGAERKLVYRAIISQSGTAAPTAVVQRDDFGLTWSYVGVGAYSLQGPAGSFPAGKTFFQAAVGFVPGEGILIAAERSSDTAMGINVSNSEDDWIVNLPFEITVYP